MEGLLRPIKSLMKIYSTATLPVYSLLQKPEKVQALRKSLRVLWMMFFLGPKSGYNFEILFFDNRLCL